jgi:NTE family protein
VLKVLEELRIPVDDVAGTSSGSLAGGLYAIGMPPEKMAEELRTIDWEGVFSDVRSRKDEAFRRKEDDPRYLVGVDLGFSHGKIVVPTGLVAGQELGYHLRRMTWVAGSIWDFDRLPIPFRAVAAGIETGEAVVIGSGDLARVIRASMAVPGFLKPVELDGRLLIDGGVASNLPVDVVRKMGAEVVIAVGISMPLAKRDDLNGFLKVLGQTSNFLIRKNVQEQVGMLQGRDVLITPELQGIDAFVFPRFGEAIERSASRPRAASIPASWLPPSASGRGALTGRCSTRAFGRSTGSAAGTRSTSASKGRGTRGSSRSRPVRQLTPRAGSGPASSSEPGSRVTAPSVSASDGSSRPPAGATVTGKPTRR